MDADAPVALSRRGLLRGGMVAAGGAAVSVAAGDVAAAAGSGGGTAAAPESLDAIDPGQLPQEDSTFFATTSVQQAGTYAAPGSDGDLWANCWGDDDWVYTANGDGRGFSDEPFKDLVVSRISGTPETGLTGEKLAESEQVAKVWGDPTKYNRKPTGMVCVGGVLYLAVQDLRTADTPFDDAPNASISRSDDHGRTWTTTETAMFTDHRFTTIFFADFGKDSREAVPALGARDGAYVYAYGMDWNWRLSAAGTVPDPVDLYLARVPAAHVQERARWEFFTGTDGHGRPTWSPRIEAKVPVLHDPLRRFLDARPGNNGNLTTIGQGGVLYHPVFKRYLYTSWSDPSFEMYEAPQPWGPWRRFHYENFGLVAWYRSNDTTHTPKNGGYGTTMPSKYVSADGRDLWLQSNWWNAPVPTPADNYNFNLRRVRVTPYRRQKPTNRADGSRNLAISGADATPYIISAHYGNVAYLNDRSTSASEDSFDGTNKNVDFWGWTFPKPYSMSRLTYATGTMFPDGGWFSPYAGGLRVQVRQDFAWKDVDGLSVSPEYPYSAAAGEGRTYTFRFRPTWGDGIRLIGQPGGDAHFTSVSELGVYFDG